MSNPPVTTGTRSTDDQAPAAGQQSNTAGNEHDQINLNIAAVRDFYDREEGKLSPSQRVLERISGLVGQTAFLAVILVFVATWITLNTVCRELGVTEFDPAPYFWLQGVIGLFALLTATVVLSKQNRLAKLAEQRANLDLKVTLLTEQKAAKLIDLLEELRRDLPNVKNRHDAAAETLQQAMNPSLVLAALDDGTAPIEAAALANPADA